MWFIDIRMAYFVCQEVIGWNLHITQAQSIWTVKVNRIRWWPFRNWCRRHFQFIHFNLILFSVCCFGGNINVNPLDIAHFILPLKYVFILIFATLKHACAWLSFNFFVRPFDPINEQLNCKWNDARSADVDRCHQRQTTAHCITYSIEYCLTPLYTVEDNNGDGSDDVAILSPPSTNSLSLPLLFFGSASKQMHTCTSPRFEWNRNICHYDDSNFNEK